MGIETSWAKARVVGIYEDADGARLAGAITTSIDSRLTSVADTNTVIAAGRIPSACKRLNTNEDLGPSIDVMLPSTDDTEIQESGWKIILRVTFCAHRPAETYVFDKLEGGKTYDLSEFVPIDSATAEALDSSVHIIEGRPGVGIASITDADGDGIATVTLTDGSTMDVPLPRGQDGATPVISWVGDQLAVNGVVDPKSPHVGHNIVVDAAPVEGSTNIVESGGVFGAIDAHVKDANPHPAYDDMPNLSVLYRTYSV